MITDNFALIVVRNIKIPCTFADVKKLDLLAFDMATVKLAKAGIPRSVFGGKMFVYKMSVDARKKDAIMLVYSVAVGIDSDTYAMYNETLSATNLADCMEVTKPVFECSFKPAERPVVVGFGPSGMFCALALAKAGLCPIVLERGADVDERTKAVQQYWTKALLDENTNVQFGEGGAGTFSDGKLLTRISDELSSFVLSEFVSHGAPDEILYLAKPHIGTDNLRNVVKNIRKKIISLGGEVRFLSQLVSVVSDSSGKITCVETQNGESINCGALFLCIGHSAVDTIEALRSKGIKVEPKAFSVGARIEHLQSAVDEALYGSFAGAPALSKAQYTLSRKYNDRAVYSFCMCPGGTVVASASSNGQIVTNGMSNYSRDGKNANSAIAVSVNESDYGNTVEGAIEFQRSIERKAFEFAGNDGSAPIQTLGDFLSGTLSHEPTDVVPSYTGSVRLVSLDSVLPEFVSTGLRKIIPMFEHDIKGFSAASAVLTAPETRTSSPVRITRNDDFTACGFGNLYPCGEGAGYAGGITSAAVDGLHAAMSYLKSKV